MTIPGIETETQDALEQLGAALMLMRWPPTVNEKEPAWAAVESPIATAKQSSRDILASGFKRGQASCEDEILNVTPLTRPRARRVRPVTERRGARD